MKEYTKESIKKAFWEVFHERGELWFPYGDVWDKEEVTTSYWKEFTEALNKATESGTVICLQRMMMDDIQSLVLEAKNSGEALAIERARDTVIGTFRCYHGEEGFYANDDDDECGFYGPIMWEEIISVSIQR